MLYGRFLKFHSVFSGRDPGTLKSDIVSNKHPQLICSDLRLSNWKFEDWNYGNRPYRNRLRTSRTYTCAYMLYVYAIPQYIDYRVRRFVISLDYICYLGLSRVSRFAIYSPTITNFIVFLSGRDPGTLKSDIVSKKSPQLICSDLRLSNWNSKIDIYGNRPQCNNTR